MYHPTAESVSRIKKMPPACPGEAHASCYEKRVWILKMPPPCALESHVPELLRRVDAGFSAANVSLPRTSRGHPSNLFCFGVAANVKLPRASRGHLSSFDTVTSVGGILHEPVEFLGSYCSSGPLHKYPGKVLAMRIEDDEPQYDYNDCQRYATWVQEHVI